MRTRYVICALPFCRPVDVEKAFLEGLGIVVNGLAGLDPRLSLLQRGEQIRALLVREHGDFFHGRDRHTGAPPTPVLGGALACH